MFLSEQDFVRSVKNNFYNFFANTFCFKILKNDFDV